MCSRCSGRSDSLTSRGFPESQQWQQRLSDAISNTSPYAPSQYSESGHGAFFSFMLDYGLVVVLILVALVLYFQA